MTRVIGWTILLSCLCGCINVGLGPSEEVPEIRFHAVVLPASPDAPSSPRADALAVAPFSAARRYGVRVVARDAPEVIDFLEFERWSDPPDDAVFQAMREALASTGRFGMVSPASSGLRTSLLLEGQILDFDLRRSAAAPWSASLRVRLDLSSREGSPLHSGVFHASHPISGPKAEGLGLAMGLCVTDVAGQALAAWTAAGLLPDR